MPDLPSLTARDEAFVTEVERLLREGDAYIELCREHPELLLGTGLTLDSLPPPPSEQVLWTRAHRNHAQGFITRGRDQYGPIMVWGCQDCRVLEPDARDRKGTWAAPTVP